MVVEHGHLDPVALAGLASRRTYPLRSSFRPTYNMAVNLVAQVGRERAREVPRAELRAVPGRPVRWSGLARQARAHAEALAGLRRGDDVPPRRLRGVRRSCAGTLSRRASRTCTARRRGAAQAAARAELAAVRRGDVLEIAGGRRAGPRRGARPGHRRVRRPRADGPDDRRPRSARCGRPTWREACGPWRGCGCPQRFSPRNARSRSDLASAMRSALADPRRRVERPARGAGEPSAATRRRDDRRPAPPAARAPVPRLLGARGPRPLGRAAPPPGRRSTPRWCGGSRAAPARSHGCSTPCARCSPRTGYLRSGEAAGRRWT